MKYVKKILLALTAVAMMVVLLSTSAFAAGKRSSKQYVYTCFGDSVSAGYGLSGYENNGTITKLVKATDESGAPAGYVAETYFSGAQGMITMVVGVGADNSCTGIYVTKSSETAGLGALASETQEGAWRDNLAGTTLDTAYLAKDGGSIAAIAGATITSRACTNEARYVMYVTSLLG